MSRKKTEQSLTQTTDSHYAEAFSFGEPVPMLDRRELLDYVECISLNGQWYEPPVSFDGLARSLRAAAYHESAITVKANVLSGTLRRNDLLSKENFKRLVLDYLVFGNAFVERRFNRLNEPLALFPSLAKYTRRGTDSNRYWFIPDYSQPYVFNPGAVLQLQNPDINQELYGLPEYLSALQAAWLNESATLFRRKYYLNGSHAGFILYVTDTAHNEEDINNLRQALKESKGPGNFRNLFFYAPQGKKDGMQVIPLSEVAAKDEFFNIKNVTRDDLMAVHRVPPQLMGIMPNNTSGFGDAEKAATIFYHNEIVPLQNVFKSINDWLGIQVIAFDEYQLLPATRRALM